jgi:hypothetical protein
MPRNNKIYWFEGVTEKGVKSLLNDQNSKFTWLRSQRNRRILVILMALGFILMSLGSYWPTFKTNLDISSTQEIVIFSVTAIFCVLAVIGGYGLLRFSVRGIADAPDELLDERQIQIRNSSFRYAYLVMGFVVTVLLILLITGPALELFAPEGADGSYVMISVLFAFASMPSMVLAWREKDI